MKRINRKSNLRGLFSTVILIVSFFISISIANFFEQTAQKAFGSTLGTIDRAENLIQDKVSSPRNEESTPSRYLVSPAGNKSKENVEQKGEIEPEPDEFILVDKEPGLDLKRLASLVKYPKSARKSNIQGTVILRILVDKSGKVKKILIDHSDNEILNSAAEKAMRKYGSLTPAMLKGKPITCWVSIPVRFKLR